MSATVTTPRRRIRRTLRIGGGVAAFAFGVWMLCLHISPRASFWFTTRWCAVGSWQRGVQLRIGNADQREEYRQALIRANQGGRSVWPRGAWDVRWPSRGVFDAPIWLIAFPWWPAAAVGLGGGSLLLWPRRGATPGARRILAGGAVLACAAGTALVWQASALKMIDCPFGVVNATASSGVLYVDVPGWALSDQRSFVDRDLAERTTFDAGGKTFSTHAWMHWGVGRDTLGGQLHMWMPLWAPVAAMTLCGGLLVHRGWRARRRWLSGGCARCGYDLRGLGQGAVCPECGEGTGTN